MVPKDGIPDDIDYFDFWRRVAHLGGGTEFGYPGHLFLEVLTTGAQTERDMGPDARRLASHAFLSTTYNSWRRCAPLRGAIGPEVYAIYQPPSNRAKHGCRHFRSDWDQPGTSRPLRGPSTCTPSSAL